MSETETTFWMVYGEAQQPPAVKHETRVIAETEAKRLARFNPGIRFFVLEAVSIAEKIDVRFTRIARRDVDVDDDEIPF